MVSEGILEMVISTLLVKQLRNEWSQANRGVVFSFSRCGLYASPEFGVVSFLFDNGLYNHWHRLLSDEGL